MQKFRGLPIAGELAAGFGLVTALMLAVALVGVSAVGSVGDRADYLGTHTVPGVSAIKSVDAASMDYRGTQYALVAETCRCTAIRSHTGGACAVAGCRQARAGAAQWRRVSESGH